MTTIESKIQKAAMVTFFGPPNAGKSTLLNLILGEKLAPVHHKPQMTRKNLLGIYTKDNLQLVFIDTPGIHESQQRFNQELLKELDVALKDCDIVLGIMDVSEPMSDEVFEKFCELSKLKKAVLVLNKCDLKKEKWKINPEKLNQLFTGKMVFMSCVKKIGLDDLFHILKEEAPEHPFYYPEDEYTTSSYREITQNIILEKIMDHIHHEIPYQVAIDILEFKEGVDRVDITADIIVNRDSQKGMVIGKKGQKLKAIGSSARKELQAFIGKKIGLNLFVKVDHNWIKKVNKIKGYYGFEHH